MDLRTAVAGVFDRLAATYDQVGVDFFQPIASGLVCELAPRVGERALDIGCGRGAVLIPFGLAVGAEGSVTGIDLSPNMVAAARQTAADAGVKAKIIVGDAQEPELPAASYDLIGSSLVLFVLPEPLMALRAWRELLAEGGRLGISTFGDYDKQWRQVDAVFLPYLPPGMRDARTSGTEGDFSSDAGVEQLLRNAGFTGVRTATTVIHVRFTDPDHWHRWSWSVGQRAMWEAIPEGKRPEVKALAYEQLEACRDDNGHIGFDQHVRYTLGDR